MNQIAAALNKRSKPIRGSRLLMPGLADKKDVDDLREMPTIENRSQLVEDGGHLSCSDLHVHRFEPMRTYRFDRVSVALPLEQIASPDRVDIVTTLRSIITRSPPIRLG